MFSETERVLSALAKERLTQKEKLILLRLSAGHDNVNVTRLVPKLSEELGCAPSTVWSGLKPLRKIGLIEYGSPRNRGTPVRLTPAGRLVSENLNDSCSPKGETRR